MKKLQTLFVLFAVLVSACAIPMASVKARQPLPLALPKGCVYADQGGIGDSGSYMYVNGFSYDPGTTFLQFAQGNAYITIACAESAAMAGYTELYRSTAAYNEALLKGGGDDSLKAKVVNLGKAVEKLNTRVDGAVELSAEVAEQSLSGAAPATGKPGKVGSKQATAPQTVPAPAATPAPAPAQAPAPAVAPPAPAPVDPSIIGRIEATKTNAQLVGVLRSAAQADPAHATMFNNLAAAIGGSAESSFEANKKTLADSFR